MEFSRPTTQNVPDKERCTLYFESLSKAMESAYGWECSYSWDPPGSRECRFQSKANTEQFWNHRQGECCYRAWFPQGNQEVVAGLLIRESQPLLNALHKLKREIEADFGDTLDWSQRLCRNAKSQKRKIIFASRRGNIQSAQAELQEISEWHIETLLKLNEVFTPRIKEWRHTKQGDIS